MFYLLEGGIKIKALPISFYQNGDTPTIARNLLGKIVVHLTSKGTVSGRIVETEAYLGSHDPASHSARGKTPRNTSMFGEPGTSYIYISYGVHHCLNAVCQTKGIGEAILIRALEPLSGIAIMRLNRPGMPDKRLTDGPGKLCQAFGIDMSFNGCSLQAPPLSIVDGNAPAQIGTSGRIGLSVGRDLLLRFYIAGNSYVSRTPRN